MFVISSKKWVFITVTLSAIFVLGTGIINFVLDPYFHYRKPIKGISYQLREQRYINNGIVKNFDYDAIITGTSMTENFKVSEFDRIFGVDSIKVPFSGGTYKEINDNLDVAVKHNDSIKIIIRGLDYEKILDSADLMEYDGEYPTYLYNDDIFDDIKYIMNKNSLMISGFAICNTILGKKETMNFDTYSRWQDTYTFGKDAVEETYERLEKESGDIKLSEDDYKNMRENISRNVVQLARENKDIEFYYFFTPYSIYYWDSLKQSGEINRQLDAERYVIEYILNSGLSNMHLFSFFNEYDTICDLNNYKDIHHYGENINSQMLLWMKEGHDEITKSNYEEYCKNEREFYLNYDYDDLFQ